jgi:hypothetical protein
MQKTDIPDFGLSVFFALAFLFLICFHSIFQ